MNIVLDEGYLFGMGAFETVAVYDRPVFLDRHLARLAEALEFLGIQSRVTEDEVSAYLEEKNIRADCGGRFAFSRVQFPQSVESVAFGRGVRSAPGLDALGGNSGGSFARAVPQLLR